MQAAIVNGQVSNNEEQNVQRSILPLWSFPPAHLLEHDELASGEEPSALIIRALSIRNIPKKRDPNGRARRATSQMAQASGIAGGLDQLIGRGGVRPHTYNTSAE